MDKKSRTVLFSISSNALLLTMKLVAGIHLEDDRSLREEENDRERPGTIR